MMVNPFPLPLFGLYLSYHFVLVAPLGDLNLEVCLCGKLFYSAYKALTASIHAFSKSV